MAIEHAKPGELIDVRPLGPKLPEATTRTLFKAEQLEVIRLVLPTGKEIAEHRAPGEIIVQCLEGIIEFTALGQSQQLTAGQMLYLDAGQPHAVKCLENASFLLTLVRRT